MGMLLLSGFPWLRAEDPRYLRVSGCCKHFAAYSVENLYNGTSRHDFNALVTAQVGGHTPLA